MRSAGSRDASTCAPGSSEPLFTRRIGLPIWLLMRALREAVSATRLPLRLAA